MWFLQSEGEKGEEETKKKRYNSQNTRKKKEQRGSKKKLKNGTGGCYWNRSRAECLHEREGGIERRNAKQMIKITQLIGTMEHLRCPSLFVHDTSAAERFGRSGRQQQSREDKPEG